VLKPLDLQLARFVLLQVAYDQLSPLHAARNPAAGMSQFMPPVLLLHGTTDKSVPVASSLLLNDALQTAGVDTEVGGHVRVASSATCRTAGA
jgi:predicted esterase